MDTPTPPTPHRGRPLTEETPLSERERAFIAEYLTDFQAKRAAIAVGYVEASAHVTAYKVLARAHVQADIAQRMADRLARLEITADRVLKDIDAAANLDLGELFDADGDLRPIPDLPAHVRRAIVAIEVLEKKDAAGDWGVERVKKIKLIDKGKMHEILAKHKGLYHDGFDAPAAQVPAFALPPDTPGVSIH